MPLPILQILTANRLKTGEVLYWREGNWVEGFDRAELFSDAWQADAALAAAQVFVTANQVVSPYLFEVREDKAGPRPIEERESIRSLGPSIRPDTCKQADHVSV
jgi:sulfite reductase (NADPH) hemoprotein beta-component